MDAVSVPLAVTLVVLGTVVLVGATVVAVRDPLPDRAGGRRRLVLLGPWVGSALVVVLLVRGSLLGAVVVAGATLLHVTVARARASRTPGEAGRGPLPPRRFPR